MSKLMKMTGFAVAALACVASAEAEDALTAPQVTGCDRLTSYVNDEGRVAPPVARVDVDPVVAIAACEAAIARDPDNGRLHYQLGRVLGYVGRTDEARAAREKAAELGYASAIFVLGYVDAFNKTGNEALTCEGAARMEKAARAGAFAGLSAYPAYRAQGLFRSCEGLADTAGLLSMLDQADTMANDFYKTTLISTARAMLASEE